MTIAALLSHFGVKDRRFVTADGLILFDGVSGSPGFGYTHPQHGAVSPVVRHTFHGGIDEPAGDAPTGVHWWDDPDALDRHDRALAIAFPRFVRMSIDDERPPVWTGCIDTGRGRFVIQVSTRIDQGLPSVRVLGGPQLGIARAGRWIPSPHLYLNGSLCVADQSDWDPSTHTVATVVAWAAHWLAAYTEWRIIQRWPTEGAQPDAA